MQFKVTIPPTEEPITLEEAKLHLRVDGEAEDAYILALIQMAREYCENYCHRALMTQTVTLVMTEFSTKTVANPHGAISLPHGNVQRVESIKYIDTEGVEQTWQASEYLLHSLFEPALVSPAYGKSFPDTRGDVGGIKVTYVVGWTQASDIPTAIKQAMLLAIGDMYENREDTKRMAINASQRLLNPYKMWHL